MAETTPTSSGTSPRVAPRAVGATAVSLAGGALFVVGQPVHAATFDVTSLNESGPGSLNDAIRDADLSAGIDTITVTGTITLASSHSLPAITDDVISQGPGSTRLTIDGTYAECDIIRNWDDVAPTAPKARRSTSPSAG